MRAVGLADPKFMKPDCEIDDGPRSLRDVNLRERRKAMRDAALIPECIQLSAG